jgi:hypothetical protein
MKTSPMSLAEIDESVRTAQGAMIVSRLAIEESGVDPIGLRQLNLDLMDAAIPGINNVTTHIRPYAFMAWAWDKAFKVMNAEGQMRSRQIVDLVARYETFYAWALSLKGAPLPGAGAVRKYLPLSGSGDAFAFEGPKWEEFKQTRLSFMHPTQYGPSIKALRVLDASTGFGVFVPCVEFAAAIAEIDGAVAGCVPARLLAKDPPKVTCDEVLPLALELPIGSPSQAERHAFRLLFFEGGGGAVQKDIQRRRATIQLIQSILPNGDDISVPEIRRRLATGKFSSTIDDGTSEMQVSASLLMILQARQLQRQSIEAMMVWVGRALPRPTFDGSAAVFGFHAKSTEELADAADALCAESSATLGAYIDTVIALAGKNGWPAAAALPGTDVVDLVEALSDAQQNDVSAVPKLALLAVGIVYAITKACISKDDGKMPANFIDSRADRLPMGLMAKRIDMLRDRPLRVFWNEFIERWVIAQHVHWSAVRGGDGKQRLRIGLEGGGWIRIGNRAIGPFVPTPDRLATLLSLGSECGLFRKGTSREPSFGRWPDALPPRANETHSIMD